MSVSGDIHRRRDIVGAVRLGAELLDFRESVVESANAKYLLEPKADDEMRDPLVVEKARAAAIWCEHATAWELTVGGKPWRYLLVPDGSIVESATLEGLLRRFG